MATARPPGSATLTVTAIGVVYGDIGTSPLYALKECFHPSHGLLPTHDNVIGLLSLIVWALLLVVSIKYVVYVLRADNEGEGGILALLAGVVPPRSGTPRGWKMPCSYSRKDRIENRLGQLKGDIPRYFDWNEKPMRIRSSLKYARRSSSRAAGPTAAST